jgi:hypothetical protein
MIVKDKAQKILNMIIEFEREFEKDNGLTESDAVKRIKKIVEEVTDALDITGIN